MEVRFLEACMKKIFLLVIFSTLVMAQPAHRVVFSITSSMQYPYGLLSFFLLNVDYEILDKNEAVTDIIKFSIFPVPIMGIFGEAQYRRYFQPFALALDSEAGYWNVGWVGGSSDIEDGNLFGLYAGVGYEKMLNDRWSAQVEFDLYPLALLDGLTTPGSWGIFFSAGARVAFTYRF